MNSEVSIQQQPEKIPVTLLTGFLGSGKTTALNHLVRQPELADTLVIINEFGEMALDHLLVAHSTENLVMEMSSGCLCCTIRGDLVKTLREIIWRFSRNSQRQFKRVMIETTGLADPAPIVHTLMTHPHIAPRYRLDGIAVTIDMATGSNTLDEHSEAIKQAAVADSLLLTKSDLATDEQKMALLRRLDDINPAAPRYEVHNGKVAPEQVLDLGLFSGHGKTPDVERWLKQEAYAEASSEHHEQHSHDHDHGDRHHHHDVNRHDDHINSFCFVLEEPISKQVLSAWLGLMSVFVGTRILRVKGIINVKEYDQPIVVHGVQHVFHPPVPLPAWPSEDRRSHLVFITQDVGRDVIKKTLDIFQQSQTGEAVA